MKVIENKKIKENNEVEEQLLDEKINIPSYEEEKNKDLYFSSSFWSKLFFFWNYLIIKAPTLDISKYTTSKASETSPLLMEQIPKKPNSFSMLVSIFKANKKLIIKVLFLSTFAIIFENCQFISLRFLIQYLRDSDQDNNKYKFFFAFLFILSRFFFSMCSQHEKFNSHILSTTISNQITSLIYNKVLSMYSKSSSQMMGKIINFIQFDSENISFAFNYGSASLVVPFQIIISFYIIYLFCEKDFVVVIILVLLLLIAFFIGYIIQKMYYVKHGAYLEKKDKRVKITNDTLNLIQEIKINRYEEFFYDKILKKRKGELSLLNDILDQGIVNTFVFNAMPIIMAMFIFTYLIYFKSSSFVFSISNLITIILILNTLAYPLYRFPVFITCIAEAKVSLERIIPFIKDSNDAGTFKPNISHYISLLDEGNINSICLTGTLASGKSTILIELLLHYSKTAFTSQDHFLIDDTIKENIIFGDTFDQERYDNVLKITQLNKDIDSFDEGDMKICGINGSNLSGGQRARVDIARALYRNYSSIYLFDDAFASLDDKVGKEVFIEGIQKHLINNQKKIIASFSNCSFIENELNCFDYFIYLDKGNILFEGKYDEFKKSKFYQKIISKEMIIDKMPNISKQDNHKNKSKQTQNNKKVEEKEQKDDDIKNKPHLITMKKLIGYIGKFSFSGLVLCPVIFEICEISRNYFFVNTSFSPSNIKQEFLNFDLISILSCVFLVLREFTLYATTYYLNITLHNKMLISLLKAPMNSFHFNVTNSEKINRLNKDLEKLRYPMKYFTYILKDGVSISLTLFLCSLFSWYTLLPLPFITFLSYFIVSIYLNKSLIFNRIERQSSSPVISSCNEAINGALFIKCYKREKYFTSNLYNKLNHILLCKMLNAGGQSWFGLSTQLFGGVYMLFIAILCLSVSSNNAELILVYSLNTITNTLKFLQDYVSYYNVKTPLDRCDEFASIPNEIVVDDEAKPIMANFDNGIEYKDFSMKYNLLSSDVLKNISFQINPTMKVAVIGRTGSGKSSLILSLLRIIQGKEVKGSIEVDGININKVNLYYLRSNIGIVTQKPFIYDGTFREMLDPKYKYENDDALSFEVKKMKFMDEITVKYFEEPKKKIKASDLSAGEKQLICLCRALLKKNKILVLDEATANIDINTEKLIYDSIDTLCHGMIIISIMHKKEYLNRFDMIITLESGKIISLK